MTHTVDGDIEVTCIPGYEDRYAVSRCGRIWSFAKKYGWHDGRWLKPTYVVGYPMVTLNTPGLKRQPRMLVHRAVAITYIPNPENKPEVNHKDLNRGNPHIDNLEWTTTKENVAHAILNGARPIRHGDQLTYTKVSDADVLDIYRQRYAVKAAQLAERYGVSESHIVSIWSGRKRSHITQPKELTLCHTCL